MSIQMMAAALTALTTEVASMRTVITQLQTQLQQATQLLVEKDKEIHNYRSRYDQPEARRKTNGGGGVISPVANHTTTVIPTSSRGSRPTGGLVTIEQQNAMECTATHPATVAADSVALPATTTSYSLTNEQQ
jgi:hypothetical protein